MDINTIVSKDNPEQIVKLLSHYDKNTNWDDPSVYKNLSGEQLVAIWLKTKDNILDNITISEFGNQIFSESNTLIKFSSNEILDNWIFNIYEQLASGNPDWDIIKINIGETDEDEDEFEVLKSLYSKNPKETIQLYLELMQDSIESEAINFIFKKEAQEKFYSKKEIENLIIDGEDLENTDYGPINIPLRDNVGGIDPSIIDSAIEYATQFVPSLQNKAILSGQGSAYGVVETDLQRKLAKRKVLEELNKYPDQISESEYNNILQLLNNEINKSHAIRINPEKINNSTKKILSEIEKNVLNEGLGEILNEIKIKATIISVGSVIAHEAEHASVMNAQSGDPRGESSAEQTERSFIEYMLNNPEFKYVKPFLMHDQQSVSSEEVRNLIENIKLEIQKTNDQNWYNME